MRNILTALFVFACALAYAQPNFQILYDTDREHITTTFEMFKPDKWGSTFTFIDFDYNHSNGISGAYYEIARNFKIGKDFPIEPRLEYNGGMKNINGLGISFNSSFFLGGSYSFSKDRKKYGITTYVAYKHIAKSGKPNVQYTFVWYLNMADGKLKFNGFFDWWTNNFDGRDNLAILLTEPQIWYNFSDNFAIGGELELSNNFGGADGFKARPALGVKWTFK